MDWIVERGVEKIPDGVSFERPTFVEPVNTCLKAVEAVRSAARRCGGGSGPGPDRPDVHHADAPHRRARGRHRHHRRAACELALAVRRASSPGIRATTDVAAEVQQHDRRPRRRPGDRGRLRARNRRAGRGLFAARAPEFCYSPKLRARNASKSPARTSVWENARFSGAIALSGPTEGVRRSGFQRRAAGGRTDLPPLAVRRNSFRN